MGDFLLHKLLPVRITPIKAETHVSEYTDKYAKPCEFYFVFKLCERSREIYATIILGKESNELNKFFFDVLG